uniref:Uncharacterized protein n=1 Tax=Wuchereria bancrofti TaxID=6293 RepID=A0AAF5PI88_WUCBA
MTGWHRQTGHCDEWHLQYSYNNAGKNGGNHLPCPFKSSTLLMRHDGTHKQQDCEIKMFEYLRLR